MHLSALVWFISAIRIFRFLRVEPWDKVVPSAVGARNIMANREIKYICICICSCSCAALHRSLRPTESVPRAFVTRFLPLTRNKNMCSKFLKTRNNHIKDLMIYI